MPHLRHWLQLIETETSAPRVLRTVPAEEANQMLHDVFYGGKNKGQTPTPFHRENEEFVLVDLPLTWIQPNEEGDLYDATTDPERMRRYAQQRITTPVFISYSRFGARTGLLGYVADGGHRVSAARLRGDRTIRALLRQSDFARLVARMKAKPN
jgi:hypothetical protein